MNEQVSTDRAFGNLDMNNLQANGAPMTPEENQQGQEEWEKFLASRPLASSSSAEEERYQRTTTDLSELSPTRLFDRYISAETEGNRTFLEDYGKTLAEKLDDKELKLSQLVELQAEAEFESEISESGAPRTAALVAEAVDKRIAAFRENARGEAIKLHNNNRAKKPADRREEEYQITGENGQKRTVTALENAAIRTDNFQARIDRMKQKYLAELREQETTQQAAEPQVPPEDPEDLSAESDDTNPSEDDTLVLPESGEEQADPTTAETETLPLEASDEPATEVQDKVTPKAGDTGDKRFRSDQSYISWLRKTRGPELKKIRKERGFGRFVLGLATSGADYAFSTHEMGPNLYDKYVAPKAAENNSGLHPETSPTSKAPQTAEELLEANLDQWGELLQDSRFVPNAAEYEALKALASRIEFREIDPEAEHRSPMGYFIGGTRLNAYEARAILDNAEPSAWTFANQYEKWTAGRASRFITHQREDMIHMLNDAATGEHAITSFMTPEQFAQRTAKAGGEALDTDGLVSQYKAYIDRRIALDEYIDQHNAEEQPTVKTPDYIDDAIAASEGIDRYAKNDEDDPTEEYEEFDDEVGFVSGLQMLKNRAKKIFNKTAEYANSGGEKHKRATARVLGALVTMNRASMTLIQEAKDPYGGIKQS